MRKAILSRSRPLIPLCLVALAALGTPTAGRAQDTSSIVVLPAELELEVGASHRLVAEVRGPDGAARAVEVRWFATGDVVSVSEDGRVTAHRPGRARVAAVWAGRPAWAEITVPRLPPAEIEVRVDGEPLGDRPLRVHERTAIPIEAVARTRLGDELETWSPRLDVAESSIARPLPGNRLLGVAPGRTELLVSAAGVRGALARVPVEVVPRLARDYRLEVVYRELEPPPAAEAPRVETGDVVWLTVRAPTPDGGEEDVRPLWTVSPGGATVEPDGEWGVFVAEEPGRYAVTAVIGPDITRGREIDVEPREHTARLELVGHGLTATHRAGDTWVFEGADGRDYAYLGTFYHDWMKVWDVTDPSNPVLTDSLQLDARRINDVKIHPDGRLGVVTREGASNRRNGIVLLDLSEPAHPTVLSEYTETVTGGVHNVWIRGDADLVYACHNGTSDLHIIDISDPRAPREVGRWGLDREGKTLHDVIVQDGYAYLSYWDDGVVTLDVGAGTHGGTPTEPAFVSRYGYPEGHTHVAWRHGRYLFVGDEIYPDDWDPNVLGPIEARGYVHVLDVSDIERPVEVARYEVPEAGAHNLWTDDRDRLYLGYYQAGLRVVDISGELRGDLYRQGREIGAIKTSSPEAAVPNWSMTWGAQLFKGRIYSSDLFSGLWVTRLVERELVP